MDNEEKAYNELYNELKKWYIDRDRTKLTTLNLRVKESIKELKTCEYAVFAEFNSRAVYKTSQTSGLRRSSKEALKLLNIPIIDSSKATVKGKNLMITMPFIDSTGYLSYMRTNRELFERENIVFINFKEE